MRWRRYRVLISAISMISAMALGESLWAKKHRAPSKKREVQEVNFEEMTLQGQIRSPYGAYLVQKNGTQFLPLYQIQKDMDQKIRSSMGWMR